ncbi:hypothetical protein Clacol_008112 [Clathrus columnatus]|uniref:Uncharacterized protein n=1 Tax=Clathrus columnatus TaxID=1419009 RepID=A0AAV5APM5_9AGAM|nr:hypothetical protein Clacol_008112 [Clathrus columnatus]
MVPTPTLNPAPADAMEVDAAYWLQILSISGRKHLEIPVELQSTDTAAQFATKALLDTGASGLFIDIDYIKKNNLPTIQLLKPQTVYNVDGTENEDTTKDDMPELEDVNVLELEEGDQLLAIILDDNEMHQIAATETISQQFAQASTPAPKRSSWN